MNHKYTTFFGGLTIAGAVAALAGLIANGHAPTAEQWVLFGGAIATGAGHLMAADAKNVKVPEVPAAVAAPAIAPAPLPPASPPGPPA